jgi:hypothetical protein
VTCPKFLRCTARSTLSLLEIDRADTGLVYEFPHLVQETSVDGASHICEKNAGFCHDETVIPPPSEFILSL